MKFIIKLIVIVFVFFQFSSTIIYLMESDSDNAFSVELVDEDQSSSKDSNNVKDFIVYNNKNKSFRLCNSSIKVQSTYILQDYAASSSIFIPPPKEV